MNKTKGNKGGSAYSQPLDPTTSGEDFIGDTTGLTGITTGSAQMTSRTPNDEFKDENKDHLPGGILDTQTDEVTGGRLSPNINIDDDQYKREMLQGMSQAAGDAAEDIAREGTMTPRDYKHASAHIDPNEDPYTVDKQNASGDDSPNSDAINTESAPFTHPENLGEQSISGSASDPTSDDDTLEAAHAVGTQLEERDDMEHPQELDIARDIDKAEEYHRNH